MRVYQKSAKLFLSLITFNCICACQNQPVSELNLERKPELVSIKGGTKFGQCRKDCIQEIQITNSRVLYKLASNEKKYRDKNRESEIAKPDWENLLAMVNADEFKKLPDVVGCPDCSDGGAEWIEIAFADGITKRVTYNFLSAPPEIKSLAKKLAGERAANVEQLKKQFPKEKLEDRAQSNEEYDRRKKEYEQQNQ